MSRFTFDTAIERGDDEIEVRVAYEVSPFISATYWQPAEGGEVEIISITPDTLTEAEEEKVYAECEARAPEDEADAYADHQDYLYEQYRDRQMTDAWEAGL